jgi:hypothetical protein
MILWWIGNIVFLAVVIPLCAHLLVRVLRPVKEIEAYAADTLEHGVGLIAQLDAIDELRRTQELVGRAATRARAYAGVYDEIA